MDAPTVIRFDMRRDLQAQWRALLVRATTRIDLFDPDFSAFPLGVPDVEATLRAFLRGGGLLRLALHDTTFIERSCPRFLGLARYYNEQIECRQSPRSLRHLSDSLALADGVHVVRRFHCDHMRGEAAFDAPAAVELPAHRFEALWEESRVTLSATVTGL
ncbi:hypothetical protein [Massilia sp. Leaf139]|uniref:DUF7931 domain-containing protein n=1 Tax=Massilia sp. Leaf139 TaxID=1736272 RepID=UPI0006F7D777|nr:hypothetical protein [Massilia sp. Leaf139]KQQ96534.1 hypothetical protein ASF77_00570 [Massilia sp. Leaf139]